MLALFDLVGEYACWTGLARRLLGEGVNSGVKGNFVKPVVVGDVSELLEVVSWNIGRGENDDWEEMRGSVSVVLQGYP